MTRSVGSREAEIYIEMNLSKPEKKYEYASWAYLPHFRNIVELQQGIGKNEKKLDSNYRQNQAFVTVIPQESPKAWDRALGDIERG